MHRVKRPEKKAEEFGFSQVQYRTTHENLGEEPQERANVGLDTPGNFQLNAAGGPLGEDFDEQT